MPRPHIQVVLVDDTVPTSLQTALCRINASTSFWPLSEALRNDVTARADAIVVVVPDDPAPIEAPLRVLFDRLAEHPRATLVLTSHSHATPNLSHPDTLPITFFSGQDDHDLSGRLTTMLEMRDSLDSLHRGLLANRRSGQSIARQYVNQLRLASQVQREFLPESLPRFGPVSFNVLFRPVDYVSGDIYDVHRLDEEHVGIAIADATGHGIPAALLTVYIKRALRGKEIVDGAYRILPPHEVLVRLNEDILEAQLNECPFVAAVYAVLNIRTREVALARGGAPYPLVRRANGEVETAVSGGGVVGVLPQAQFDTWQTRLEPGDSLLLYSDGVERVVAPEHTVREVPDELRIAARDIDAESQAHAGGATLSTQTAAPVAIVDPADARSATPGQPGVDDLVTASAWCEVLRRQGTAAALEQLAGRQHALRRVGYPLDDLTALCVHIDA